MPTWTAISVVILPSAQDRLCFSAMLNNGQRGKFDIATSDPAWKPNESELSLPPATGSVAPRGKLVVDLASPSLNAIQAGKNRPIGARSSPAYRASFDAARLALTVTDANGQPKVIDVLRDASVPLAQYIRVEHGGVVELGLSEEEYVATFGEEPDETSRLPDEDAPPRASSDSTALAVATLCEQLASTLAGAAPDEAQRKQVELALRLAAVTLRG